MNSLVWAHSPAGRPESRPAGRSSARLGWRSGDHDFATLVHARDGQEGFRGHRAVPVKHSFASGGRERDLRGPAVMLGPWSRPWQGQSPVTIEAIVSQGAVVSGASVWLSPCQRLLRAIESSHGVRKPRPRRARRGSNGGSHRARPARIARATRG